MLQDLYAVISTLKPSPSHLPALLEHISGISPSDFQEAPVLSLLDDNETLRGIKIYPNEASSHPLSAPRPITSNDNAMIINSGSKDQASHSPIQEELIQLGYVEKNKHQQSSILQPTTTQLDPSSIKSPRDESTPQSVVSQHRYKYYAGFIPDSFPENPYILWADVYYKPTSHPADMLTATKEIIKTVCENEPGTLCYLWLQDVEDERHISVFEMYRSREDLKVHEGTEWYAEYGRRLSPSVSRPIFREAEWKGGCFEGIHSGV